MDKDKKLCYDKIGEKMKKFYLAIDIGASSGRHIVGWQEGGEIATEEVYRFPNGVKEENGHLVWDIASLFSHVKAGIKAAFSKYKIESLAIDTWGVDYVLMNGDREILPCYAYRDSRTERVIPRVHRAMSFEELYAHTGIQFQPFNTVYQLYDDLCEGRLETATDFLMLPAYLSYRLTGVKSHEYTNASTTGLLNADGEFDAEIVSRLGFPERLFPAVSAPGTKLGPIKEEIARELGGCCDVVLCASHDTGSAVEGIPMEGDELYISSGTWSLLGVKAPSMLSDEKSREANWTNEGGVGYIRYLKNIMGLWVVNRLREELCPEKPFGEIQEEARGSEFHEFADVNAESFLAPKSMKQAFDDWFRREGKGPEKECDYFNCAFLSLAVCYMNAVQEAERNLGKTYRKIYIVGGGAKNKYLNELTAQACKKEVVAIPIEATAIGNLKIQIGRKI